MSDGAKRLLVPEPEYARRLGRHLHHDPRNRGYSIRELLPKRASRSVAPPWWRRGVYDQQGSSCTMQAAAGVLASSPFRQAHRPALPSWDTESERHAGYLRAQTEFDPWAGGEPDYYGSSTDAPFKLLAHLGHIEQWRWCFGFADVLDTLRFWGPLAVGTWWYDGMDQPHPSTARVKVEGDKVGGHTYEVVWDDVVDRELVCVQSWGYSGTLARTRSRFRLSYADAEGLLADDGEAVTIVPTAS